MTGWVLDAPAITAFARNQPYAQALVWASLKEGSVLLVPAAALAEAYAELPTEVHDAVEVLLGLPITILDLLDAARAADVGLLLADPVDPDEIDHYRAAIATGHVVAASRSRDWPVVTDSTARIHALDTTIDIKRLRS